ncbi:hypothetical protein AKO1_008571 [Acrasis kona]|uniref:RWP-RK domain-containing protein n=1 Tax=Acrasis kona TaxID=1008807 RepID=A0AAW2YMF4_9EUKA
MQNKNSIGPPQEDIKFIGYDHTKETEKTHIRGRPPQLEKNDVLKYLHLPQHEACLLLGISLSTLKRKFYELGIGKWPSKSERAARKERPMSIEAILNKEFLDEKDTTNLKGSKIPWLVEAAKSK